MNTEKSNHLTGLDRVERYVSETRSMETVWMVNYDVIKLLKVRFYYLEVRMTAARDGKQKAIENALQDLTKFVIQAKNWVSTQPQTLTNFERTSFEVLLISSYGSKLLKNIVMFDEVMCELASAQYAGGQSPNLRVNYLSGFSSLIYALVEIAKKSEPHFMLDGTERNFEMA